VIDGTSVRLSLSLLSLFNHARLHHLYVNINPGALFQGFESCLQRIVLEPQHIRQAQVPRRYGTSLSDPILWGIVSDNAGYVTSASVVDIQGIAGDRS
jgi:hypothetical protein